jgi:DNA-binding transcriptional ArsR family regulator
VANPNRLRCLKVVLEEPASAVGEIAERTQVSICRASECLRALQARGLIQARRESRWVRDVAVPDPLVAGTRPLLNALRRVLLTQRQKEEAVMRTLTAFTATSA